MTAREKAGLRGPVRSLREEFAELDLATENWLPPRHYSITSFLPDGRLDETEFHNPDGSVVRSVYRYDDAGRLTAIQTGDSAIAHTYDDAGRLARVSGPTGDRERFRYEAGGGHVRVQLVPSGILSGSGVEGSDHFYSAQGAAEVHTHYDASGRAVAMRFLDREGGLLNRVAFAYDSAGRLVSEAQFVRSAAFGGGFRGRLMAWLVGMRGETSTAAYEYDAEGRRIAAHNRLGRLMDESVTWRYDRFGNRIEETREKMSREITAGLPRLKTISVRRERRHIRFEYRYDEQGNWTERVVSSRPEENPDFQPRNIERRQLTYW